MFCQQKKEITNYFKHALNQTTENMINLLVKEIIVYNDKIAFKYTKYKSVEGEETCVKIFSKTFTKTRRYKDNTTVKEERIYDIYIKI